MWSSYVRLPPDTRTSVTRVRQFMMATAPVQNTRDIAPVELFFRFGNVHIPTRTRQQQETQYYWNCNASPWKMALRKDYGLASEC